MCTIMQQYCDETHQMQILKPRFATSVDPELPHCSDGLGPVLNPKPELKALWLTSPHTKHYKNEIKWLSCWRGSDHYKIRGWHFPRLGSAQHIIPFFLVSIPTTGSSPTLPVGKKICILQGLTAVCVLYIGLQKSSAPRWPRAQCNSQPMWLQAHRHSPPSRGKDSAALQHRMLSRSITAVPAGLTGGGGGGRSVGLSLFSTSKRGRGCGGAGGGDWYWKRVGQKRKRERKAKGSGDEVSWGV